MDAKEASEVRIRELEEDIKTLTQRTVERDTELERSGIFLFSLCLFSHSFYDFYNGIMQIFDCH